MIFLMGTREHIERRDNCFGNGAGLAVVGYDFPTCCVSINLRVRGMLVRGINPNRVFPLSPKHHLTPALSPISWRRGRKNRGPGAIRNMERRADIKDAHGEGKGPGPIEPKK